MIRLSSNKYKNAVEWIFLNFFLFLLRNRPLKCSSDRRKPAELKEKCYPLLRCQFKWQQLRQMQTLFLSLPVAGNLFFRVIISLFVHKLPFSRVYFFDDTLLQQVRENAVNEGMQNYH